MATCPFASVHFRWLTPTNSVDLEGPRTGGQDNTQIPRLGKDHHVQQAELGAETVSQGLTEGDDWAALENRNVVDIPRSLICLHPRDLDSLARVDDE